MKEPRHYHIERSPPTAGDIRELLQEMVQSGADDATVDLFGRLALTRPEQRLALGLENTLRQLSAGHVDRVLRTGLSDAEAAALVDLDDRAYSQAACITARSLLCVKERWVLVKAVGGFFKRCRGMHDGHLSLAMRKQLDEE